jgi:hypothetical protein
MPRPPGRLVCGFSTRRWCAILKENELFSFIWTDPAMLIAPGDILVGFRPCCVALGWRCASVDHSEAAQKITRLENRQLAASLLFYTLIMQAENGFITRLWPFRNPPVNETAPFSHTTTCSDCIAGFGVLTTRRVRGIKLPSSWRPASADHGHWAILPENTPISPHQGKMDLQEGSCDGT